MCGVHFITKQLHFPRYANDDGPATNKSIEMEMLFLERTKNQQKQQQPFRKCNVTPNFSHINLRKIFKKL